MIEHDKSHELLSLSRKKHGFTLLEVLFCLFLVSFALLGIFSVEAGFLRKSRGDIYFQRAVMFSENLAVYLRSHQGDVTPYLSEWREQIKETMPNGNGSFSVVNHRAVVNITWGMFNSICKNNQSGMSGCVSLELEI